MLTGQTGLHAGAQILWVFGFIIAAILGNQMNLSNQVTGHHLYSVFFVGIFVLLLPEVLQDLNALLAYFFLIIGQYRLNQIRPFETIKLKLFDASLCVLIASLFLEWSLLYYLLLWVFVYLYSPKKVRNWLVPLAALILFFLLVYASFLLANQEDFIWNHYSLHLAKSFSFNYGNVEAQFLIVLGFILLSLLGLREHRKSGYGKALQMRINALVFILGCIVVLLELPNGNQTYLLTFYPVALFAAKYTEAISKRWRRELWLIGFLLLALGLFGAEWIRQ
jgi:hypothetical protein